MSEIKYFVKKPVEISGILWTGNNLESIKQFCRVDHGAVYVCHAALDNLNNLVINTFEGSKTANVGDWIIKGSTGDFYPYDPKIFEMFHIEISK